MKKKFDYYIGIDVSKLTLDVTVLYEYVNDTKTEYYKIENNEKSIAQFVNNKLCKYDLKQLLFCFEDTGIYSMPLAYYLNEQYKLVTSIPGAGMQTAIYLLVATKGFDAFENWRQLACYAGVAPFPYQSGNHVC